MSELKPLVVIASTSGRTGGSITRALVDDGNFRIAAIVRSSSVSKPINQEFASAGIEMRVGDITDPDEKKLDKLVEGADILILTTLPHIDQKPIILAAKRAAVKRVVPSDFGPPAPKGIMTVHDSKLEMREWIKGEGIPATFIEVGWWTHGMLPWPHSYKVIYAESIWQNTFKGAGDVPVLCTSMPGVGKFVARIIADPRTLNQTVITWETNITNREAWSIAEKISGENFDDYQRVSEADIIEQKASSDLITHIIGDYNYSIFIRRDCTLEKACALGALDARKLYPDYIPPSLEEQAKQFYENPEAWRMDLDLSSIPATTSTI